MKKIVLTGGHHNSALVVAKELESRGAQVIWIGHRYIGKNNHNPSAEYQEVVASKIKFIELKAGKIDKELNLKNYLRIPLGFWRAWKYLRAIKPDAVLSFGGYLGMTVAAPAWILRIPVYLHEQTLYPGKANRVSSFFARHIYLTWPDTKTTFKGKKVELVGLPLRSSILDSSPKKIFNNSRPTILVMGGKQGSHLINTEIFNVLIELLGKYNLIHQTGTSSATKDYDVALSQKNSLPKELSDNYLPEGYINEQDIGAYYASADLVISRAGGHTAYELGVLGKKSILIPFPHTTGAEQLLQANLLEKQGIGVVIEEKELNKETLLRSIQEVLSAPKPAKLDLPKDAAERMALSLLNDLN